MFFFNNDEVLYKSKLLFLFIIYYEQRPCRDSQPVDIECVAIVIEDEICSSEKCRNHQTYMCKADTGMTCFNDYHIMENEQSCSCCDYKVRYQCLK